MMSILFLFLLIPFLNCDRLSELPALLKCAEKSCIENVSTGRILEHSKLFFGDLKEVKRSAKVYVKGKNVDNKNTLWLIEFNGLKGFIDGSLIKENSNSIINDLEVVSNPFYVSTKKALIDETEDVEDNSQPSLFSTMDSADNVNKNLTDDATEGTEVELPVNKNEIIENEQTLKTEDSKSINNKNTNQEKDDMINVEKVKEIILDKIKQTMQTEEKKVENIENINEVKEGIVSNKKEEIIKNNDKPPVDKIKQTMQTKEKTPVNSVNMDNDKEMASKKKEEKIMDVDKNEQTVQNKRKGIVTKNNINADIEGKNSMKKEEKRINAKNVSFDINEETVKKKAVSNENMKEGMVHKKDKEKIIIKDNNQQENNAHEKEAYNLNENKDSGETDNQEEESKNTIKKQVITDQNVKKKDNQVLSNETYKLNKQNIEFQENKEVYESRTPKEDEMLVVNNTESDPSNVKEVMSQTTEKTASLNLKGINKKSHIVKDEHVSVETPHIFGVGDGSANKPSSDIKSNIPNYKTAKDSDPWLVINERKSSQLKLRSPVLRLIFYIETSLHSPIKSFIKRCGLDSSIYFSGFVHNWLCMSLENFVLILSLFLSIVIIIYTPKMFGWNRDWKSEFEKQSQLIAELESRLITIEDVRQKLTIHNRNFEKVIDEYKGRVNDIQEDANNNKRTIMTDLERIKKINDVNIQKVTKDLDKATEKCMILQHGIAEKDAIIDHLNDERNQMELQFSTELSLAKDSVTVLKEKVAEMDDLKKVLQENVTDKANMKEEIYHLVETVKLRDDEIIRLRSSFEELKICDGLAEEECRDRIAKCLESNETKVRLIEVEGELNSLRKELHSNLERIQILDGQNGELKDSSLEYEKQRLTAVKDREEAEMKLKVLTDYFHQKEVEMQKSLGHESVERSLSLDQSEFYKQKVENLETENASMSKSILKLKNEVKESQSFAMRCKNEANVQISNQYLTIANLERELMSERDESKKLRTKLSYYIGPNQQRNVVLNNARERPLSRQSVVNDADRMVSQPPMFPLALLPQTNSTRPQYSGRNSANSVLSKRSNNS